MLSFTRASVAPSRPDSASAGLLEAVVSRPVGRVSGGLPDGVDDDLGRRRFVEDEVRIGPQRKPPQPR